MRWYVTINGETHGPVDESVLRSWIRQKQVPPGSMVAPEGPSSSWVAVEKSSFATQPPIWIPLLIVFASLGFLITICSPERRDAAPANAPAPAKVDEAPPTPRPARACILSIPGSSDTVIVFPTEEGFDEFGKAAASGDNEAMQVARRANRGFFVESRTKCTWLDVGLAQTKVRVLEGPHEGKAGYVPTEWASGR